MDSLRCMSFNLATIRPTQNSTYLIRSDARGAPTIKSRSSAYAIIFDPYGSLYSTIWSNAKFQRSSQDRALWNATVCRDALRLHAPQDAAPTDRIERVEDVEANRHNETGPTESHPVFHLGKGSVASASIKPASARTRSRSPNRIHI